MNNYIKPIGDKASAPLKITGHCPQHGFFEQMRFCDMPFSCPACFDEKLEKEKTARELERKKYLHMKAIKETGVPARFLNKGFDCYQLSGNNRQREIFDALVTYCEHFDANLKNGRSLILSGMPGTGKTHLATGMVKSVLAKGYRPFMADLYDCILSIKKTWNKNTDEDETQALKRLVAYDLLVLDEVGVQFGTETEKLILFRLLNKRYEQLKPVVLISNLKLEDIASCLGERIIDRLKENGGQVLGFTWNSHRARAAPISN